MSIDLKDAEPADEFSFQVAIDEDEGIATLSYAGPVVARERQEARDKIVAALRAVEGETCTRRELEQATGLSPWFVRVAIKDLVDAGLVGEGPVRLGRAHTKTYVLT